MTKSPSKNGQSGIYLHQGSMMKAANNSSRTETVGASNSITKTLDAQQTPHFDGPLGLGLQNSKSPFQAKQSHKHLRGSVNPNSIRDSIIAPDQNKKPH